MKARDELAVIVANSATSWHKYGARYEDAAAAILASGYRKPRTITTAEELDELPVGSIVLDRTGDTARKFRGGWRTTVAEPDGTAWLSGHMADADLPATVLHEGAAA